jgi:hypothetical protein
LHHDASRNLFFILARLDLKSLIYSPFLSLSEDVLQFNGRFAQIVLLIELSSFGDGETKLEVGSGEDFVFYHFELDDDC